MNINADKNTLFSAVTSSSTISNCKPALICFSHLRWDFVRQRPQHLMDRFSKERRVFNFEEPILTDHHLAYLETHRFEGTRVVALRPRIPARWSRDGDDAVLAGLLNDFLELIGEPRPVLWFYTPMLFACTRHLVASAVVYDCMDELSGFRFAPARLKTLEAELMQAADVVFTGGTRLYESRRNCHDNLHCFPSSVDVGHFAMARTALPEPLDQDAIPHPRLGFYGVIDERIDLGLVAAVAKARPDWQLVLVGPLAKIDERILPRRPNIHYLGQKTYEELPAYLSGWDVALMPFADNDATAFISPTKTPEYLAGGRPVVSTPVADVVRHYGHLDGVSLARTPAAFVEACEAALEQGRNPQQWLPGADRMLAATSWDETYSRMSALVSEAEARKAQQTAERSAVINLVPWVKREEMRREYDVLVVGAGFAGGVLAERLASESGKRVLVVDRREHIAGNAYDHHDAAGILVHRYGPHIFHTNSHDVIDYLSRFTRWRPYEHRVLARVGGEGGKLLPVPINRTTLEGFAGVNLPDEAAAAAFLAARAEAVAAIATSEDVVVSSVGRELYEAFFRGYTLKQWGLDPSQLDPSVTARVPTRTSRDDRYFLDTFQAMPADGYTRMFEKMLDHPLITVELGVDYEDVRTDIVFDRTIYTGPIDEFFGHRFGALPYRCLSFKHETKDIRRFQQVGVVNYPGAEVPYTRITEYKHLTGQVHPRTSISYEYSSATGDPYYPVPRAENQALYKRYEALARERPDVSFVGRLATYRYYNMDQVVGQALATYRKLVESGTLTRDEAATGALLAG
jgi:UDP-galactopyranose mutase